MAEYPHYQQHQQAEFYPCGCFQGARAGYVFKLGEAGLGYHTDLTPASPVPIQTIPCLVEGAFTACDVFQGARNGYVFKLGAAGLGYYRDSCQLVETSTAPSTKPLPPGGRGKPVMIKSNKSIVKVPIVPNDTKRRKVGTGKAEEDKPHYLQEMELYRAQSCSSDTKHERPLVK